MPGSIYELEKVVREEQRIANKNEADSPTEYGSADHLYDLPSAVGEAITTYNHDPWPQPAEDPFEGMFQALIPR